MTTYEIRVYNGYSGDQESTESRDGVAAAADFIMDAMAAGKACNVYHGPHLTSCTQARYGFVGHEAFAAELRKALTRR